MSWMSLNTTASGTSQADAFAAALDALHAFHDAFVSAAPDADVLAMLETDLRRWTATLEPMAVPELERLAGRMPGLPVRGHAALPPLVIDRSDEAGIEGTVTFGQYFLGGGSAAHGGMIATIFDEVLGVYASSAGRSPARTAYLTTNYRSVVPLDVPVRVRAWFEREEGRKRFVRGEMWHGETLCAEADALFVELRPGGA
ncbi:MAG: thioesterase [Aeromicrobium sp.]|nr:thioesterase [Aeromicrobium sp.]